MLDAGRIGRIGGRWLLDGRRGSKDVSHARRSRRSADDGKRFSSVGRCLRQVA